jgi:tartrate dehydratase beta subunit/fumarate hydratase class I family protein
MQQWKTKTAQRAFSNSVGQRPTEMATSPTARPEGALAIIALGASPRKVWMAFNFVGRCPTLMLKGLSAQIQHSIKQYKTIIYASIPIKSICAFDI